MREAHTASSVLNFQHQPPTQSKSAKAAVDVQSADFSDAGCHTCECHAAANYVGTGRRHEEHAMWGNEVITRMFRQCGLQLSWGGGPSVVATRNIMQVGAHRLISRRRGRLDCLDPDVRGERHLAAHVARSVHADIVTDQ